MRENRTHGSEGGEAQTNEPSLPLSAPTANLELPTFGLLSPEQPPRVRCSPRSTKGAIKGCHRTSKETLRLITIPEDQAEFEREVGLAIDRYKEQ